MVNTNSIARVGKPSQRVLTLICILAGVPLMFTFTFLLHFSWEWMGKSYLAALFSSVNESVWEHVKILLIPYLVWGVAEYYILRPNSKRMLAARVLGALVLMTLTICFYFIYSGIIGSSVPVIDIISAFLWIAAAELVCQRALAGKPRLEELFPIALAAGCIIIVMLLCFTASPPHIGLFRDPKTLLYGLETRV